MIRLALVLCFAGCTETISYSTNPLASIESIEIVPSDATLTLDDLAPPHHSLAYVAMARFRDGRELDVTELAKWSVDDQALGGFEDGGNPGVFIASHAAVGRAHVAASIGDVSSAASLTVQVDATLVDPSYPPPGSGLFDPSRTVIGGDVTHSPTLLYPADGTRFPRGISRTLFQADLGAGNEGLRIQFDSELLHLAVETGADRWAADGDLQQLLTTAGLGAPLQVQLFATTAAPGPVYTRAAASLSFSRDVPGGPLFFWSAATNGIMRGAIETDAPTKMFPPVGASSTACVGCHAVSRDGKQMALAVEDGTSFDLQALDVPTLAPTIQPTSARRMAFATYSPDGSRVVVASGGVLTEYDASTGATIGTISLGTNKFGSHPDWSPDGTKLAIALSPQAPTEMDIRSSSIAIVPRNGTSWGMPQTLVAGVASNNNYFPRWSPDGQKLAYVHATTNSQGAVSAQLMLLPAAGGTPIVLATANTRVGVATVVDLANTSPAWGPTIGDHAWLAFVSIRAYGAVAVGRAQIWVTSVDLASLTDSSTPAFWLPSQDSTVVNNTPTWSANQFTL